jgi:stage II sporulation protein R
MNRLSVKVTYYIAFALIILISSWEMNLSDAAVTSQSIPEESIRLRILANSDSPQDQWVKREVRDQVRALINEWVADSPQSLQEARDLINSRIPELQVLVGDVLKKDGFNYDYKVELAVVPFPTKMYGKEVYPAGEYEALRITLGNGEGQNWWCVLFPPLCFVDLASGEAFKESPQEGKNETGNTVRAASADLTAAADSGTNQPEVRFFLWDLFKAISGFIQTLFA